MALIWAFLVMHGSSDYPLNKKKKRKKELGKVKQERKVTSLETSAELRTIIVEAPVLIE
jgi:hypothetical protein